MYTTLWRNCLSRSTRFRTIANDRKLCRVWTGHVGGPQIRRGAIFSSRKWDSLTASHTTIDCGDGRWPIVAGPMDRRRQICASYFSLWCIVDRPHLLLLFIRGHRCVKSDINNHGYLDTGLWKITTRSRSRSTDGCDIQFGTSRPL